MVIFNSYVKLPEGIITEKSENRELIAQKIGNQGHQF